MNELLSTTGEVRRLLADPPCPASPPRIEQGVAALTERIDALTTKLADRNEVAALADAVVRDQCQDCATSVLGWSSSGASRRLSAKIDQVMREPLTLVGQHLADLSSRFPAARECAGLEAAAAQASALAKISERLDKVSAKLDQVPRGVDGTALNDLRARLDDVAQTVERSAAKTPETLDRLLRQVVASLQSTKAATWRSPACRPSSARSPDWRSVSAILNRQTRSMLSGEASRNSPTSSPKQGRWP